MVYFLVKASQRYSSLGKRNLVAIVLSPILHDNTDFVSSFLKAESVVSDNRFGPAGSK